MTKQQAMLVREGVVLAQLVHDAYIEQRYEKMFDLIAFTQAERDLVRRVFEEAFARMDANRRRYGKVSPC